MTSITWLRSRVIGYDDDEAVTPNSLLEFVKVGFNDIFNNVCLPLTPSE